MTPERHIDNACQRIDMAMGLIALGKAHALLGEALDELRLAIATEAATAAETVEQGSVHEGAGRRHRPAPIVAQESDR